MILDIVIVLMLIHVVSNQNKISINQINLEKKIIFTNQRIIDKWGKGDQEND